MKHKFDLLEKENEHLKASMTKVGERNTVLERDLKATMSLVKSLDRDASSADSEYYKRKVRTQGLRAELCGHSHLIFLTTFDFEGRSVNRRRKFYAFKLPMQRRTAKFKNSVEPKNVR